MARKPKPTRQEQLDAIPVKRNSDMATKVTFVTNAMSVPEDSVLSALGAKPEKDQKIYFRVKLRKTSAEVLLVLLPSLDENCAVNRLMAWKVNKAGKRFYISSTTILRAMGLSEEEAQNSALPFMVVADEIRVPFPRKVVYGDEPSSE